MASLLFQATSITLLLLPFLTLSTSFLLDTDNDPIMNGRSYYIVPHGSSGGLTYIQKKHSCPLYIAPDKSGSPGTPVRISSPLRILYINENMRVTLEFEGSTPCDDESLVWKRTIDSSDKAAYITTGGDVFERSFSITKKDQALKSTYELRYWDKKDEVESSKVGLHEEKGELLGLTDSSTTVSFKKAFDNVIELPSAF